MIPETLSLPPYQLKGIMNNYFFAVNLETTSDRIILGSFCDQGLELEEVNRFPTQLIEANGYLYWDIYALYSYIIDGLKRVAPEIQRLTGLGAVPVIAVVGHDTASAVAAVPALSNNFAYLSSGTWSLMGSKPMPRLSRPKPTCLTLPMKVEWGARSVY